MQSLVGYELVDVVAALTALRETEMYRPVWASVVDTMAAQLAAKVRAEDAARERLEAMPVDYETQIAGARAARTVLHPEPADVACCVDCGHPWHDHRSSRYGGGCTSTHAGELAVLRDGRCVCNEPRPADV